MDLENIILSEVTQTQKNTHGMHSLINGYWPRSLEYLRHNSHQMMPMERKGEASGPEKAQCSSVGKYLHWEVRRGGLDNRWREEGL